MQSHLEIFYNYRNGSGKPAAGNGRSPAVRSLFAQSAAGRSQHAVSRLFSEKWRRHILPKGITGGPAPVSPSPQRLRKFIGACSLLLRRHKLNSFLSGTMTSMAPARQSFFVELNAPPTSVPPTQAELVVSESESNRLASLGCSRFRETDDQASVKRSFQRNLAVNPL